MRGVKPLSCVFCGGKRLSHTDIRYCVRWPVGALRATPLRCVRPHTPRSQRPFVRRAPTTRNAPTVCPPHITRSQRPFVWRPLQRATPIRCVRPHIPHLQRPFVRRPPARMRCPLQCATPLRIIHWRWATICRTFQQNTYPPIRDAKVFFQILRGIHSSLW